MKKIAQECNVSRWVIREVAKKDLGMKPFISCKWHLVSSTSKAKRLNMSKLWLANNPDVIVMYSDEKLFEVTKKYNEQNDHMLAKKASNIADNVRHGVSVGRNA